MIELLERKIWYTKILAALIGFVVGILFMGLSLFVNYDVHEGHIIMNAAVVAWMIIIVIIFTALGIFLGKIYAMQFESEIENEMRRRSIMKLFKHGKIRVKLKDNSSSYSDFLIAISKKYELKYFANKKVIKG